MALPQLTSSDVGAPARDKINAGLVEAGKVADLLASVSSLATQVAAKASAAALTSEANTRQSADAALSGRIDTLSTKVDTKATDARVDTLSSRVDLKANIASLDAERDRALAAEAALGVLIAPYFDLVGSASDRPGDALTLFTRVMTGSPKARPAIDKGTVADGGELGQVLRISGTDTDPVLGYIDVAPRRAYYMRPGRTYLVQHQFKRFQNPSDPLQHAVELRFQNLNSNFGIVSNVRLGEPYAPTEANGAFFVDTFIGKAGAPGTPSYTVPATSAYGVPFFRVYGNGAQTDLGLVRLYDVSDALAGGADIASILARVSSFEARLKALEGTTGIDPSYIDGIAQDRLAVRSTLYRPRPGETIRGWTASLTATAVDAVPLAVGGLYSIASDGPGKGPALRITGEGSATSIAKTHLDDGEVVDFTFRIARRVDNTGTFADVRNVPVLGFCCYKADGTTNGTVSLPSTRLLAADLLRTVNYRASLTPGIGSVDLPANTRFISPLFGSLGTGAVECTSVDRSSQSLTSAPEMTDAIAPEDRLFIFDDSAKLIKKLTPLKLAQYVEAYLAPPPIYWFKGPKAASTSEATMIAAPGAGAIVGNVRFQNKSKTAFVAVSFRDVAASLTDGGSYLFGPGQGRDFDIIPQGRIGFISDTEGSPITCEFTSTANLDPNSADRASKHLARYGSSMNAAQSAAVANLYNALYDSGWLDLCSAAKGGALWIGRAPGNFDGLINWSGTNNFGRLTVASDSAPPETSFAGTLFNGTSVIDSLVKPPLATLPNCALFTWTDASVKGSAKVSAGNTVLRLNVDRTSNDDAMYTGAGSSIVSGVPGVGGLKGFVRQNENTFRYYRNDTFKVDVAKTLNEATGGSQTITIGGLNTGSGIQQIQTTAMELAAIVMNGRPSDAQVTQLYTAFSAFRTALGA